jgi:subtilisin family serine protease
VDIATVNLVNSGVCTIVAAGNDYPGANRICTPGSVDEVLTVAAMNQFDGVTSYSSQGGPSRYTGQTVKPDLAAPGGSFYAVPLFSVDSNTNDAQGGWSDTVAEDGAPMQGTSMSTPIVAGAAQVLVEALGGFNSWSWTRSQALLPKMLLLMTATETYPNLREAGTSSTSPTLNRGGKDVHEGYGRVNVDAAADAVLKTYQSGTTVSDTLGKPPTITDVSVLGQRLAWARNVYLHEGIEYSFDLTVPTGADYDLYFYNMTSNAYGEPVILTKSTTAAVGGFEEISYTPELSGTYYVVVKRARADTGVGPFTLTSSPSQTAHLFLTAEPEQATYAGGQSVDLVVNVFNQLNPSFESTLTLTVTGPDGYYYFDFQSISVTADSVWEYSFTWTIPDVAQIYVVETSLVPPQLTTYDVAWLEVG